MKDLNHQLKKLCQHNRDGSYATQRDRERALALISEQLHGLGYRGLKATSLKPKHVEALIVKWRLEGLAVGTLKNRMAVLRWWSEKVGKQNVIAQDNSHYGIPDRTFVSSDSKSTVIEADAPEKVKDVHARMSLELQQAFGLRREEAIKFQPAFAGQGDHLILKASWTKGGKAREVPIRTDEQRAVLDRAHRLVGKGSLIPSDRSYRHQLRVYEKHTASAGLSKLHGLRHRYAEMRYEELTGWKAPAAGGPASAELEASGRHIDRDARLTISRELGHLREAVTAVYLSR